MVTVTLGIGSAKRGNSASGTEKGKESQIILLNVDFLASLLG
jgi:hypothetical protein